MSEPLDLAALAAASRPATMMSKDQAAADAIFNALSKHGKLTKYQVMEVTDLTISRFRTAWTHLRHSIGRLAVVENHGRDTTYQLSYEGSIEAERYRLWQDKHIYSRLWSLRASLAQMLEIARRTDSEDGRSLRMADRGITSAIEAMALEIRHAGDRAEVPDEEVDGYLRRVSAGYLRED
jgi:hypothetical protein